MSLILGFPGRNTQPYMVQGNYANGSLPLYRLEHDHRRCFGRRVLEEAGLQFKPAPIFNGRV
jgi:hypothetical protein